MSVVVDKKQSSPAVAVAAAAGVADDADAADAADVGSAAAEAVANAVAECLVAGL